LDLYTPLACIGLYLLSVGWMSLLFIAADDG
jgi:hypothetical protein